VEPSVDGSDVDLAMIVERLRNVPKPQQAMAFAETVDSARQAGDPDYKKPATAAPRPQPDDDFDTRYGLKPSTFGIRS
ncbi:ATPase, partial [Mesorhizobium sp. M2A.F.Ca.ET.046.02.1.1]